MQNLVKSRSLSNVVLGMTASVFFFVSMPSIANDGVSKQSIKDLDFLIGEWEGQSTFFYPRDEGRTPSHETVRVLCQYVLKDTYIQCDTAWTNAQNQTRTFRLHFNHNQLDKAYQLLFIYDNWPRHVSYLLNYDDDQKAYFGFSEFEDANGQTGQERVEWRLSDDKRELHSTEFNHLESDPENYWANSFEFVWRKID